MKKIAFYGGSFDPPHNGHFTIARKLTDLFNFDEFFFVPAFHAPHKKRKKPTSAFHRFAMLALATENEPKIKISTIELESPQKPYTIETQIKVLSEFEKSAEIFFIIGADSWQDITTWREWGKVLTLTNIVVVSRPGYTISFDHIPAKIKNRIIDSRQTNKAQKTQVKGQNIFITDAVRIDISATEIRRKIQEDENDWRELVPQEVANYIEKYDIY